MDLYKNRYMDIMLSKFQSNGLSPKLSVKYTYFDHYTVWSSNFEDFQQIDLIELFLMYKCDVNILKSVCYAWRYAWQKNLELFVYLCF